MIYNVSFWGVKCIYNIETSELKGVNWLNDILIPVACWFHDTMAMITQWFNPAWENPGFRFKIIKDKKDGVSDNQPPKN